MSGVSKMFKRKKNEKLELLEDMLGARAGYASTVKNLNLQDEAEKEILLLAAIQVKKKNPNMSVIEQAYDIVMLRSMDNAEEDNLKEVDSIRPMEEVKKDTIENKFCSNCGNKLDNHAKVCSKCGTSVPISKSSNVTQENLTRKKATETPSPDMSNLYKNPMSIARKLFLSFLLIVVVGIAYSIFLPKVVPNNDLYTENNLFDDNKNEESLTETEVNKYKENTKSFQKKKKTKVKKEFFGYILIRYGCKRLSGNIVSRISNNKYEISFDTSYSPPIESTGIGIGGETTYRRYAITTPNAVLMTYTTRFTSRGSMSILVKKKTQTQSVNTVNGFRKKVKVYEECTSRNLIKQELLENGYKDYEIKFILE